MSMEDLVELFKLESVKRYEELAFSSLQSFEQAVRIYINKPQVVNKWVAGSIELNDVDLVYKSLDLNNIASESHRSIEIREFLSKSNKLFRNLTYLIVRESTDSAISFLFVPLIQSNQSDVKYSSVDFAHMFRYHLDEKRLDLFIESEQNRAGLVWLENTLLPKLINWSLVVKSDPEFKCARLNTLTLYPTMIDDYMKLYLSMKDTYWTRFEPVWKQLTSTEPEKFIHEDISIACYLILAWRHFNLRPKCFVDLGCGNGLLVYILNDQGYNGYGVDMRSRKIWNNEIYRTSNVRLVEQTIEPGGTRFENGEDFLIGNHSDELSPWLPVLAYKTSHSNRHTCGYLLIPCCMFDFTAKFTFKQANLSRVDSYLSYLTRIGESFGFHIHRDKLRIPSTRNVCFVGLQQDISDYSKSEEEINELINQRIESLSASCRMSEFVARDLDAEKKNSARNCTKNVDVEIRLMILKRVLDYLLDKSHECLYLKRDGIDWNAGRQDVRLNEIASLFDKETLSKLKMECGGIKTLLKNYHQMFQVYEGDRVKLRIELIETKKPEMLRMRRCLFDEYHPDGCFLSSDQCTFKHE